jgi:hypothetical protein
MTSELEYFQHEHERKVDPSMISELEYFQHEHERKVDPSTTSELEYFQHEYLRMVDPPMTSEMECFQHEHDVFCELFCYNVSLKTKQPQTVRRTRNAMDLEGRITA